MTDSNRRRRPLAIAAGLIILAALLIGLRLMWGPGREDADLPPVAESDVERLQLLRAALAATEDLDPATAAPLWREMSRSMPEQSGVAINRALTDVIAFQAAIDTERDGMADEATRRAAAAEISGRVDAARQAIGRAADAAPTSPKPAWMNATIELELARRQRQQAFELDDPAAFRGEVDALAARMVEEPQGLILAGPLVSMAEILDDPREGLPPGLAGTVTGALQTLIDSHPRNLFVALQALRYAIVAEDPQAARLARQTASLAEPLDALMRRMTEPLGKTPGELAESIAVAAEAGDWSAARLASTLWQNVLVATEMVRADRKFADPNPLDLLEFGLLHELSRDVAREQLPPASAARLAFASDEPLGPEVTGIERVEALALFDVNFDDRCDLVVAGGGKVVLLLADGDTFRSDSTVEANSGIVGIAMVDLFMVDGGGPARLRRAAPGPEVPDEEQLRFSIEHETFPCLVAYGREGIQVWRVDGRPDAAGRRLLPPTEPTGLEVIRNVTAVAAGDFDADGDLDLAVATADDGLQLWINRGNMTFFPVAEHSQLPPADPPIVAMAIGDVDRDLDLDLITLDAEGQVGWLENLLHLQFRWRPLDTVPVAAGGPGGVAICDADGNVSWDVVSLGESLRLGLTETSAGGNWQMQQSLDFPLKRADTDAAVASSAADRETASGRLSPHRQLFLRDLDNDSWLDAVVVMRDGILVARGQPGGGFGDWAPLVAETSDEGGDRGVAGEIRCAQAADLDTDGRIDLCVADELGVRVLRNRTETDAHFMAVRFKGIADNAGDSGRVNHYAIGSTLEVRFGPHYRASVVTERTTHFGLDGYERADTFRAILPNGLTQTTVDPPADTVFDEVQTLKGSCPYLYTWDGERFRFVTDCLWAAPLGLQYAPGRVVPDRPWEYLKVDAEFVRPKDGAYEFRITEELWEIAYFDLAELLVIDHPADVDVWTNEKVGTADVTEHRLYTTGPTRPVRQATDSRGRDVTEELRHRDEVYVQPFERRIRQGLTPEHWVELDLGDVPQVGEILLLMTGWMFPTDTSLNIQIAQNPALPSPQFPSLWVPGEDGTWVCAAESVGFPGGKTKTIVIDVTEHLRRDDPRVRLRTSAHICWDAAAVAIDPPRAELRIAPAALLSAEVAWHGFSHQTPPSDGAPDRFDYHRTTDSPKWPPLGGRFSRYGDCLDQLTAIDDRLVVIGGGDEIRLRFRAPSPPPPGMRRTFLLHLVGWDKDADLNTLAGQSVEPLPFRAMEAYPPPPWQRQRLESVERLNAAHRTRPQRFRDFWTRPWDRSEAARP